MREASPGYSGTPLPRKLGIKPGQRVLLDHPPDGFDLGPELPADVRLLRRAASPVEMVLAFVVSRAELSARAEALISRIPKDGTLWVCWPKKAAKMQSDLTEDAVRDVFLPRGLVDVKVCAVDSTWSGLKVVWRLANR